jgi:hypothetical protein
MRYALCLTTAENEAHQDQAKEGHFRMETNERGLLPWKLAIEAKSYSST